MKLRHKCIAGLMLLFAASCRTKPVHTQPYNVPLSFEANVGQADPSVRFLARSVGYTVFLTSGDTVVAPNGHPGEQLRLKFVDGQTPLIAPLDPVLEKSNYLIGDDPNKWRTNIPHFSRIRYANIYPNADVIYYGDERQLRYDLVLMPGADPNRIRLKIDGAMRMTLISSGDLQIEAAQAEFRLKRPFVYQEIAGKKQKIAARYRVESDHTVVFDIKSFDPTRSLVIDPTLTYSTLLGGSGFDESSAIALDSEGNVYIAGSSQSVDFPITPAAVTTRRTTALPNYIFVTKLNATGSALVYSTYLGTGTTDYNSTPPSSIAVDSSGNVYLTGGITGGDLPTTPGAFQTTSAPGGTRAFVMKLNPAGSSLIYSTYLGGGKGTRVVADAVGNAYITGYTTSPDFPVTAGTVQPQLSLKPGFQFGLQDAFVAKLNPTGSALVFSTFLGGSDSDTGSAITVDALGNVYVAGTTSSSDFPASSDAFQIALGSKDTTDAFLVKLNPTATSFLYSTYFGGSGFERASAVVVDQIGNATIIGSSGGCNACPNDLPITSGAYKTSRQSLYDGFLARFGSDGRSLLYSTFLNSGYNLADAVIDPSGRAFVVSSQDTVAIDPQGAGLIYRATLAEGSSTTFRGIAVDSGGTAYVTGFTNSPNFPVTPGAFQTTVRATDVFVTKISPARAVPSLASMTPSSARAGSSISDLIVRGNNFEPASVITWNGTAVTTTYHTIGELRASIPPSDLAAAGTADVRVYTPDVGTSPPLAFTISPPPDNPLPIITSVNPSTFVAGGGPATIRVSGRGFTRTSVVRINGEDRVTSFIGGVGQIDLLATLTAADLSSEGTRSLTVFTPPPGGGLSAPVTVTIITRTVRPPDEMGVPRLTDLLPSSVVVGSQGFQLIVHGSGFAFGRSFVRWNGNARPTGFQNTTTLIALIDSSDVAVEGSAEITVMNTAPGGGISNPLTFKIDPRPPNPVPKIETLSQTSAIARASGFTLTVRGSNFAEGARLRWNGDDRPTVQSNFFSISASISAADLASPGLADVTVWNPGPGGGTSLPKTFTIYGGVVVTMQTADLTYDPIRDKIYASRPANSRSDRNSISQINPATGEVEQSVTIGSDPSKLAVSDGYETLYAVLDQGKQVRQMDVASFMPKLQFTPEPTYLVEDMKVLPGMPNSLALALRNFGIAVYDNGIKRAKQARVLGNRIGFSSTAAHLYACKTEGSPTSMYTLDIDASGVSVSSETTGLCGSSFEISNGLMYTIGGSVIDVEARRQVGLHPLPSYISPLVRSDPSTGKTFYLVYTGSGGNRVATLLVYDEQTFTLAGSLDIQDLAGPPSSLIRWGPDGIAFRTEGQLYLLRLPGALMAPLQAAHFSQFGYGGGYVSSIVLVNPSSTVVARGSVNLFGDGGLPITYLGDAQKAISTFTIPPFGTTTVTQTAAGPLVSGHARISSNTGVGGFIRYSATSLGTAGVGESVPLNSMIVPVTIDPTRRLTTGIAISNPNTQDVDITLSLHTLDGNPVSGGVKTNRLPPNGHAARFINELFPNISTTNFQGTLSISSNMAGKKIAAIALQLGATLGEFTALPVIPIDPAPAATEIVFPQFANGGGFRSSIFLVNGSDVPAAGFLQFVNDSGDQLGAEIAGVQDSQFAISATGGAILNSSGTGAPVAGWAKVTSSGPIGGTLRFSSPGLGTAGVGGGEAVTGFITPVSRNASSKFSTGIAVVSLEATTSLTFTLRDSGGVVVPNGEVTLSLAARNHMARFIEEIFPDADTRDFEGTVTVTSEDGPIAGVSIQLGAAPGQFTTLPVLPIR